jgi:hypothetical protein
MTTVVIARTTAVHALLLGRLSGREGAGGDIRLACIECRNTQGKKRRGEQGEDGERPLAVFHGSDPWAEPNDHSRRRRAVNSRHSCNTFGLRIFSPRQGGHTALRKLDGNVGAQIGLCSFGQAPICHGMWPRRQNATCRSCIAHRPSFHQFPVRKASDRLCETCFCMDGKGKDRSVGGVGEGRGPRLRWPKKGTQP